MDGVQELLANALAGMIYTPAAEEGDYTQDDLLYCGQCNTPRQLRVDLFGDGVMRRVPTPCRCEAERLDAEEAEYKARRKEERRRARRELAFDNTAWADASFDLDDQRDQKASATCRRYAEHFDQMQEANMGLMLYGGLGTGKTYLAACIANALLDKGLAVIMASLPTLIADLGLGEEREHRINQLATVDLLILDDVGVERGSEYSLEQAYEVINARYKGGKPLVVTTNLSMQDIRDEAQLGRKRSLDRLIELCKPVMVSGPSRRPEIARTKYARAARLLEDT